MPSTLQSIFDRIYETNAWGGGSGPGSDPEAAKEYIRFVNYMIELRKPKTFLDIGCGDCRLAACFNLRGAKYIGFDVSQRAIDLAKSNMPQETELYCVDCITESLPTSDMAHCKDVMQHLSYDNAKKLSDKALLYSGFLIACNDVQRKVEAVDKDGGYCPLNTRYIVGTGADFTMKIGDHLKQIVVA